MEIASMSILLIFGLLAGAVVVIYILLERQDGSMRDYMVLGLFCATLAMLAYFLELNSPMYSAKVDAIKFGYLGKTLINPLLICFVLRYYESKVNWTWQLLLYIVPLITLFFVFTCDSNGYYYESILLNPDGTLCITQGPVYRVYMTYNISLSLIFFGYCLAQRRRLHGRAKTLNSLLILSGFVPMLFLLIYLLGWTNNLDTAPLGIMIGTMTMAFSVLRYGLLNKDAVLQHMSTGLVFLDGSDHLLYANHAAYELFPQLQDKAIQKQKKTVTELCSQEFAFVQVGETTFQRNISAMQSRRGTHGKLLTFGDVTEIKDRMNRDAMTGLLNHASFYQILERTLLQAKEQSTPVTVAIADIDSFKKINDNFGHANGDIILIELGHLLQDVCKSADVFRYGGEEFAVIFRGTDAKNAEAIMQTALDQFAAIQFPFLDYAATFSFGTAAFAEGLTPVTLFEQADQLMYSRKKALHARERAAACAAGLPVPDNGRS